MMNRFKEVAADRDRELAELAAKEEAALAPPAAEEPSQPEAKTAS